VRRYMRDPRFPRFVRELEIFTNEIDLQVNVLESDLPVARHFYEACHSREELDYPTAAGLFRVSPRSFFQTNRFLIDALGQAAVPAEGGADALEPYAGVGLFALALAKKFERVPAVEAGASAARDLTFNATRAGVTVDVRHARVEDHLVRLENSPDFVLADPPR